MHFTIYKITNLVNNKIYIGKHQTSNLNDAYMGSGKYLKRAIEKYGISNFHKEILFVFETEQEMNSKEAELVTREFCLLEDSYNLCDGGHGGWSYVNRTGLRTKGHSQETYSKRSNTLKGKKPSQLAIQKLKEAHAVGKIKYSTTKGKLLSEEHKRKIGETNSKLQNGSNNSQFGTMWITNGHDNKKIKKDVDTIPDGWYKGRT
jgi:hypothetical protein